MWYTDRLFRQVCLILKSSHPWEHYPGKTDLVQLRLAQ
jgi:hypothetical protein